MSASDARVYLARAGQREMIATRQSLDEEHRKGTIRYDQEVVLQS